MIGSLGWRGPFVVLLRCRFSLLLLSFVLLGSIVLSVYFFCYSVVGVLSFDFLWLWWWLGVCCCFVLTWGAVIAPRCHVFCLLVIVASLSFILCSCRQSCLVSSTVGFFIRLLSVVQSTLGSESIINCASSEELEMKYSSDNFFNASPFALSSSVDTYVLQEYTNVLMKASQRGSASLL